MIGAIQCSIMNPINNLNLKVIKQKLIQNHELFHQNDSLKCNNKLKRHVRTHVAATKLDFSWLNIILNYNFLEK